MPLTSYKWEDTFRSTTNSSFCQVYLMEFLLVCNLWIKNLILKSCSNRDTVQSFKSFLCYTENSGYKGDS